MNILLSNSSDVPIYEQIEMQLKDLIISGKLKEGESLPGMRTLAKDLKVSVITTKRAYNDLEKEGYIYTVSGKGSFVKALNRQIIKEEKLKEIEENLNNAINIANSAGIELSEVKEVFEILLRGDE
ncbi:MAG: GntR family transcriptional regulator [Peptoniphilaceae bacterium]